MKSIIDGPAGVDRSIVRAPDEHAPTDADTECPGRLGMPRCRLQDPHIIHVATGQYGQDVTWQ